jgi:hypothetical protein
MIEMAPTCGTVTISQSRVAVVAMKSEIARIKLERCPRHGAPVFPNLGARCIVSEVGAVKLGRLPETDIEGVGDRRAENSRRLLCEVPRMSTPGFSRG